MFPGSQTHDLVFGSTSWTMLKSLVTASNVQWLCEKVYAPYKVVSCRCSTSLVEIVKVQWQLKGKVSTPNRFTGSDSSGQSRQLAFGCSLEVSWGCSVSDLKLSLSLSLFLICCVAAYFSCTRSLCGRRKGVLSQYKLRFASLQFVKLHHPIFISLSYFYSMFVLFADKRRGSMINKKS